MSLSGVDFRYTVSAALTLDGVAYDVTAVRLSLTNNGIPEIICHFNPFPTQPGAARRVTLSDYAKRISELRRLEYGRGTANVSVDVRPLPDNSLSIGKTDYSVTGWPVVKVSMAAADRYTTTFAASVRLAHPAWHLMSDAMYLGGIVGELPERESPTQAANVLAALADLMTAYVNQVASPPVRAPATKIASYREAIASIRKYLTWDSGGGGSFPTDGLGTDGAFNWKAGLFMDMRNFVCASRSSRPWAFVTAAAQRYMFSIVPRFDKSTLLVQPFRPWSFDTVLLPPLAWRYDFPSAEMVAFRGVSHHFKGNALLMTFAHSAFPMNASLEEVIYINPDLPRGEIMELGVPEFVTAGLQYAAGTDGAQNFATFGEGGYTVTPLNAGTTEAETAFLEKETLHKELRDCGESITARAEYGMRYRRDDQCSIIGPFAVGSPDGNMIYPGTALLLPTGAGGDDEMVRFFATGVEHVVDKAAGIVQTEIVGSHVAFQSEKLPDVVADGRNLYYDAKS